MTGKGNGKSEALDLEHELPTGDDAPDTASRATESSALEVELQKLKVERDSLVDRLARAQAEFENARRRATKEQQDFREFASAEAVKAMLPALDNFERALQAKSDAAEFRSGVELIYKQIQDVFERLGVQPIPAQGEHFDPHVHEAIEMTETTEAPDQTVVAELQRGYRMKDKLLRPALVKVAKNPGK